MKNKTIQLLEKNNIAYTIKNNVAQITLEDETPYTGIILYTSIDRTNNVWKVEFRKHKKKFFPKYNNTYVIRFKTKQEAINFINKAELK